MPDAIDSAAPSRRRHTDHWAERLIGKGILQIIIALNGLLVLLLIGVSALACVIALQQHYETVGAFIDLLRLIAEFYFALQLAVLLVVAVSIAKLKFAAATSQL